MVFSSLKLFLEYPTHGDAGGKAGGSLHSQVASGGYGMRSYDFVNQTRRRRKRAQYHHHTTASRTDNTLVRISLCVCGPAPNLVKISYPPPLPPGSGKTCTRRMPSCVFFTPNSHNTFHGLCSSLNKRKTMKRRKDRDLRTDWKHFVDTQVSG